MNKIYRLKKESWPDEVIIYTDGASRGNPGPASLGVYVTDTSGEDLLEYGAALGEHTNNVAEYTAVLKALEEALKFNVKILNLRSDSQLLIRQLIGEYKVKNAGLRPLYLGCKNLENKFEQVHWEHVRREFNKKADALANEALDFL